VRAARQPDVRSAPQHASPRAERALTYATYPTPVSWGPMCMASDCRARADEAEQMARTVALGIDRERLLAEAGNWRRLANDAECREQRWNAREPPSALKAFGAWLFGRQKS
jgi:hypothetical protein